MFDWTRKHWSWALIASVFLAVIGAVVWKRGTLAAASAPDSSQGAVDPSTAALQVAQIEQLQNQAALAAAASLGQQSAYYNGANAAAYGTSQTMQAQNDLGATVGMANPPVRSQSGDNAPVRSQPSNNPINEVGAGRRR